MGWKNSREGENHLVKREEKIEDKEEKDILEVLCLPRLWWGKRTEGGEVGGQGGKWEGGGRGEGEGQGSCIRNAHPYAFDKDTDNKVIHHQVETKEGFAEMRQMF